MISLIEEKNISQMQGVVSFMPYGGNFDEWKNAAREKLCKRGGHKSLAIFFLPKGIEKNASYDSSQGTFKGQQYVHEF